VKFFFVYKALAHPELAGNYVQPFTLEERLAHARQGVHQLGATIPWLVDPIDNRLKRALGDRPNSEFIIDPKGLIVRKRSWSYPAQVRKDLESLVGPVEKITKEEDVHLKVELPVKSAAARGVVPRVKRSGMQPLAMKPRIDPKGLPFFAKLRAEADKDLITTGAGKLYLGFHLDPFHEAHWNNLSNPLEFKLKVGEGVKIDKITAAAPKVKVASDADPREFLLNVMDWPEDAIIELTVTYFACVGDKVCHEVRQSYVLYCERDRDGGAAKGEGAGYWDRETYPRQMLARSKSGKGKLSKDEVQGLVRPHFDDFDKNKDGYLDEKELKAVADWLNYHHQPGPAPKDLKGPPPPP
jgi:hypothetical protein